MNSVRGRLPSVTSRAVIACVTLVAFPLGALAAARPLYGISIAIIAVAVAVAALHPIAFASFLVTIFWALPKSGVRTAEIPLPIALPGIVVAALLLHRRCGGRTRQAESTYTVLIIFFLGFMSWRALVSYSTGGISSAAALISWTLGPLVLLALLPRGGTLPPVVRLVTSWAFLVTVAYALLQAALGVEAVAVPGLTVALGDDLATKNNGLGTFQGVDFSKIPSTYQNGNIYGLVAAMFGVVMFGRVISSRTGRARLDVFLVLAAVSAVVLSGSRTAIVAFVLGLLVVLIGAGLSGRKVLVLALSGGAIAVTLAVRPALVLRYSLESATSSGGAGRTEQWRALLSTLDVRDIIFGTTGTPQGEGWAGITTQIGVVGTILLLSMYVLGSRGLRWPSGLAATVVAASVIDSTYYLFPTLYVAAFLACTYGRAPVGPTRGASSARQVWQGDYSQPPSTQHTLEDLRLARSGPNSDVERSQRHSAPE